MRPNKTLQPTPPCAPSSLRQARLNVTVGPQGEGQGSDTRLGNYVKEAHFTDTKPESLG